MKSFDLFPDEGTDNRGAIVVLVVMFVVVTAVVGYIVANPPSKVFPTRYAGEVVTAVCDDGQYGAAVIKMPGSGDRGFDVRLRDCALLSAHVGDTVSFEISVGGTYAYNFAVETDR